MSLQHRPFSTSIASLYFLHQNQNPSKRNMASPISPTYSSFSAPSPFSSASSASFPNENSPISESHFDNIPSPVDAVNSDVAVYPTGPVSVQMFAQGDIAAYPSEFDYDIMTLASDLKKSQVPSLRSLPPSQLFSPLHPSHRQTLLRSHDVPFNKAMNTVYIPPPIPPQRHSQTNPSSVVRSSIPIHSSPSPRQQQQHRQTQSHHFHAQQSLAPPQTTANDVMFDVDLDDWNPSPTTVNLHGHSGSSYPSTTLDSRPTSRPKQGDLVYDSGMGGYPVTAPNAQHHLHVEVQNQFFDMTNPIVSPQNADPTGALPQARASSRQYGQHQSSTPTFYSPSQISRHPYGHQQQYGTVHPAEISPLESCPPNSPLSAYPEIAATGIGVVDSDGCDPGSYMCAPSLEPGEDLKGSLGVELGISMPMTPSVMQSGWNGERKAIEGDLGDLDAEGEEVDPSDAEHSFGSLPTGSSVTAHGLNEVENDTPLDDTDESKYSEGDSSTDSDDSEFIPGSKQRRRRRPQVAMSSSYPSYGYTEGRSLRTRSGTRYTPYPNDYPIENGTDYMDHYDQSPQGARSRRYSTSSASPTGDTLANLSNGYLNFTTLSASSSSASRRRPRPSNSLPVPTPVPHLTKKSRGRRVPTVSSLEDLRSASSGAGRKRQTVGKGARMYLCEVEGCGKCFARGEHLKRHVRSIHTYEKPHRCPYPACGKDFSRHDNLGQHMRVHKDYVPPTKA